MQAYAGRYWRNTYFYLYKLFYTIWVVDDNTLENYNITEPEWMNGNSTKTISKRNEYLQIQINKPTMHVYALECFLRWKGEHSTICIMLIIS